MEIADPIILIIILALIMILGFIGNLIFNRTQIPSIVWLLVFGLFIGFLFDIFGFNIREIISNEIISGVFGAIAIVIILFDGGINTDLHQLFKGAPRGLLLTVSGFCLSLISTMLIVVGLAWANVLPISVNDSLITGLFLGAVVAGTSSPIVIPLAYRLKNLQEKTKMVSSIESILTDPLCIVVVFALYYMVFVAGEFNLALGFGNLAKTFSVGIVLGIAFGFIWLPIMDKIRKEQFSYILTLAVVFLVYSFTAIIVGISEGGEGAGAIACLMFGLVLGNGKKVLKMIDYEGKSYQMDDETKQFHGLTSFVIRTFFFVYLGIIVAFQELQYIFIGIIVLIGLFAVRYLAIFITTYKGNFELDDKQTMLVLMPRGLAAAILAIKFGPDFVGRYMVGFDGFFKDVAFVVILGTAIITTIGVSVICHYENKKNKTV
jgi:cell volume regulation protein A